MRLIPNASYGTTRYPDKVARQPRTVNIAAWIGAALSMAFAISQSADPTPDMWKAAVVNAAHSAVLMTIPLLHRFGPLAAPCALLVVAYSLIVSLTLLLGVQSGLYLYFVAAPALAVLFFGMERPWIVAAASTRFSWNVSRDSRSE